MEKEIFRRIRKFNLPLGQYAVFGSALMDVWGIRHAADLDIIVTPGLFESLKNRCWTINQGHGFTYLSRGDVNVTTNQDQPTDGDYNPDRRRLIAEAMVIHGLPFVRIEEVIACKKAYDREKDRKDIKLIREFLRDK